MKVLLVSLYLVIQSSLSWALTDIQKSAINCVRQMPQFTSIDGSLNLTVGAQVVYAFKSQAVQGTCSQTVREESSEAYWIDYVLQTTNSRSVFSAQRAKSNGDVLKRLLDNEDYQPEPSNDTMESPTGQLAEVEVPAGVFKKVIQLDFVFKPSMNTLTVYMDLEWKFMGGLVKSIYTTADGVSEISLMSYNSVFSIKSSQPSPLKFLL